MPRWSKLLIEIYGSEGFEGHWEVTPEPDEGGFDCDDLPRIVGHIRGELNYGDALLAYCEDGSELVIGVFCGVEPPACCNRGRLFVPDFSDEL